MRRSELALRHVADVAAIAARLLELEARSRSTLSPAERADARTWYVANRLRLERVALDGADRFALIDRPDWVADVVHAAATLSPATSWAALLDRLPGFLADALAGVPVPDFPTYGRQRALAARIVREGVEGTGGAKGPKVRPFALALLGDASQVVVDRHVARYALGDALDDLSRVGVTAPERRAIQDAHRVTGTALGIPPRDLQSLLWVARVGYGGSYGDPAVPAAEGVGP